MWLQVGIACLEGHLAQAPDCSKPVGVVATVFGWLAVWLAIAVQAPIVWPRDDTGSITTGRFWGAAGYIGASGLLLASVGGACLEDHLCPGPPGAFRRP